MTDLDELRHTLRQRERFAPNPDAVLHSALRNARHRGMRRKAVGVIAGTAVAATAGLVALGVTSSTPDHQDLHVAAPPSQPSSTAAGAAWNTMVGEVKLPFTVGWVPAGYRADAWRINAADSSRQYVGDADFETIVVRLRTTNPAADQSSQPTTVNGHPASLRTMSPGVERELSWQIAPGHWASVLGRPPQVTDTTLQRVAESVTEGPSTAGTVLRSLSVPTGFAVYNWTGGTATGDESGTVCPTAPPRATTAASKMNISECVEINVRTGSAPSATATLTKVPPSGDKPGAVVTQPVPLDHATTVDGVAIRTSADSRTVVRQLDPAHWLLVTSRGVAPATLARIAADAR